MRKRGYTLRTIPIKRENNLAKALRGELRKTVYAVTHTCGDTVYWDDKEIADLMQNDECPWCGGINGNRANPRLGIIHTLGKGNHVRRALNVRCVKHERDVKINVS